MNISTCSIEELLGEIKYRLSCKIDPKSIDTYVFEDEMHDRGYQICDGECGRLAEEETKEEMLKTFSADLHSVYIQCCLTNNKDFNQIFSKYLNREV